jgi:hypothetical protein
MRDVRKPAPATLVGALGVLALAGLLGLAAWHGRHPRTGLLGLPRHDVEARIGAPVAAYHPQEGGPPVYAYCLEKPARQTRATATPSHTYGPCTRHPEHPITILGRYERGRLSAAGYVGPPLPLADGFKPWQRQIAKSVAGIIPSDQEQVLPDMSFHLQGPESTVRATVSRFRNGVILVVPFSDTYTRMVGGGMHLFYNYRDQRLHLAVPCGPVWSEPGVPVDAQIMYVRPLDTAISVIYYAPGTTIDENDEPMDEPVVHVMNSLSLEHMCENEP